MAIRKGICEECVWNRQRCKIQEKDPVTRHHCEHFRDVEDLREDLMRQMEAFIS